MRKAFPLFVLQAAFAAVALVPSASQPLQAVNETPVEAAAHTAPMPVVRQQAQTAPMPKVRLKSRFDPAPMPIIGVPGSTDSRTKLTSDVLSALFDGRRSRN